MAPADSEAASLCRFLRTAPRVRRDRIPQQRHAKGETVSYAEFSVLRRAKAPKLNRRAERCTTIRAKDVLTETA
jgi:hypothetical protein